MAPETVTARLLRRVDEGDAAAAGDLLPLLYGELREIAARLMRGERKGHTLQTTALIHEAWIRLTGDGERSFENRRHFVRLAARAMRRVLVDHARARNAAKRGGGEAPEAFDDFASAIAPAFPEPTDLLALEEALTKLGEKDEELLRIVELRYFAGLTLAETAEALGSTERKVQLAWTFARGWLRRELSKGE